MGLKLSSLLPNIFCQCEGCSTREYRTLADAEKRLPYFIEQVYNRKRLFIRGYMPPDEFETLLLKNQTVKPRLLFNDLSN